jgi:hypothetical protein
MAAIVYGNRKEVVPEISRGEEIPELAELGSHTTARAQIMKDPVKRKKILDALEKARLASVEAYRAEQFKGLYARMGASMMGEGLGPTALINNKLRNDEETNDIIQAEYAKQGRGEKIGAHVAAAGEWITALWAAGRASGIIKNESEFMGGTTKEVNLSEAYEQLAAKRLRQIMTGGKVSRWSSLNFAPKLAFGDTATALALGGDMLKGYSDGGRVDNRPVKTGAYIISADKSGSFPDLPGVETVKGVGGIDKNFRLTDRGQLLGLTRGEKIVPPEFSAAAAAHNSGLTVPSSFATGGSTGGGGSPYGAAFDLTDEAKILVRMKTKGMPTQKASSYVSF